MAGADTTFGAWLKQRRKTLDLTQQELADLVGCSTITIRKIEANALRPSVQIAERLAQCCEVPQEEHATFVRFARSEAPTAPQLVEQPILFKPDATPNNLSEPPTPLIGRAEELERIKQHLFGPTCRLLTLLGPPGVGKTRLALEVAASALSHFPDGVYTVSLAPIQSAQQALETIAHTLKLHDHGGGTLLNHLKEELFDKKLLLVLDNIEQVLDTVPFLNDLLSYCPYLKILVTSREVLRSRRERRFPLAPLPLPTVEQLGDPEVLSSCPAVALFVERAQSVNPSFELTRSNAADVAAVCAELGGLPLSIELIAARSMLLSPKAMRQQLSSQLAILNYGSSDHPQRQRTLRDAIQWSFDLLEPHEQQFFARLGSFPTSCTMAAVEEICCDASTVGSAIDNLSALVDKSLVTTSAEADGEPRFGLLQVIREYAIEQLQQAGEYELLRERHARYYQRLGKTLHDQLASEQMEQVFDQIARELYHFRAALQTLIDRREAQAALELASNIADFWHVRGYSTEGRRWLKEIFAVAEATQAPVNEEIWLEALNAAGFLAYHQSDYQQAREFFTQSLRRIAQSENKLAIARVSNNLALIHYWEGALETAHQLFQQCITVWREQKITHGVAHGLMNLSQVYHEHSSYAQARQLLDEALALWDQLGARRGRAMTQVYQSQLALTCGDAAFAQQLCESACDLSRELQHRPALAMALAGLGRIHLRLGRLEEAQELLTECLNLAHEIGSRHIAGTALLRLAQISLEGDDLRRAEQLLAEGTAIVEAMAYRSGKALSLRFAAQLAWRRRQLDRAQDLAQRSLEHYKALGNAEGMSAVSELLAVIAATAGDHAQAATQLAAAATLRNTSGVPALPIEQRLLDQLSLAELSPAERAAAEAAAAEAAAQLRPRPDHDWVI